ncbi:MAG: hypothetical protein H7175_03910 [Burkholderiales bacterium]|nr:hypothetical protein [Anaerolineae bacterium]
MAKLRTLVVFGIVGLLFGFQQLAASPATIATRYLAFQMFTGAPDPSVPIGVSGRNPLSPPPSKDEMSRFVQRMIEEIGTTGDAETKLAFIIGPLAFDHTDAQLRQMIEDAFEIALEQDIAVGFHIDDSMFWARRSDLWEDPANVEWLDWEGTPGTGRRLDWGPEPTWIFPQMCVNSAAIQAAVHHLASDVIGDAVSDGIDTLEAQGKPELFAGVIMGWETQIGRDFETDQYVGYCALTNRGFSREQPPQDLDREREQVVQAFIELWAGGIAEAGVSQEKIYSHTAVVSTHTYENMEERSGVTYSQVNQFAPPSVSFGEHYNPGYSTYPQQGLMEQLYDELERHGSPAWASAEGTNVQLGFLASGGSMETYLAWMFNHGAALVNIFGWGVGSETSANPFRTTAEAPDSLAAYRKFLGGEALVEGDYVFPDLPARIQTIQSELPAWIEQNPSRQPEVEALMLQLSQYLEENNCDEASRVADEILALITP